MARYENVIFLDGGDDADEVLNLIDDGQIDEAFEYLKQWHYPGEHDSNPEPGHGTADEVWGPEDADGYIMSANNGLGYVGLEFDTEFDEGFPDE